MTIFEHEDNMNHKNNGHEVTDQEPTAPETWDENLATR